MAGRSLLAFLLSPFTSHLSPNCVSPLFRRPLFGYNAPMRVVDRYLWREMAVPFLSGIAGFVLILLGNSLFELLRLVGPRGLSGGSVGALLGLQMPSVAVSRLGRDSELTALRMAGVSLRRCLRPTMVAGLAASAAAFAIGEYVAP